jgi:hypothetical protein
MPTKIKIAVGLCLIFLTACQFELDTNRQIPNRGTLGEEIYAIFKKDYDRMQPQKGLALERQRQRLIRGIDTLLPDEMLDDFQQYLLALLPLYDEQIIQASIRPLACILNQFTMDDGFMSALWYWFHPHGYDLEKTSPVIRRILSSPVLPSLLDHLGQLWLAHDGLDTNLKPSSEDNTFTILLDELADTMTDAVPGFADQECTAAVLFDFLLSPDERLKMDSDSEQWIVRTDVRGRALVYKTTYGGQLADPFVDMNNDGLADIDPVTGDFVDRYGDTLYAPPPFSTSGDRSQYQGGYIYQYSDLSKSVLAALIEQMSPMIEDGLVWELPEVLPVLLGEENVKSVDSGYDPDQAPIIALAHAGLVLLDYHRLPEFLDAVLTIAQEREPLLAKLIDQFDLVKDIVDKYPHQKLADNNGLLDDLIPILLESAERGYLDGFVRSFADPRSLGLGAGVADMIRYSDHLDDQSPGGMSFSRRTDFYRSDLEYANRSNFQKLIHMCYDTNGASHTTDIAGFDLYTIEDMLVFYLDSAADTNNPNQGLAEVPWWVAEAIGEFSSAKPSAEEVNRFMNHDHGLLGNPAGHEGYELLNYNGEALLAFEVSGFLDALKPGITAFATMDRGWARSGTKVLADLMARLHPHYSIYLPFAADKCANVRALEPVLLDILDNSELITITIELLGSLNGMKSNLYGADVLEELDGFISHVLTHDGTIRTSDGSDWVYGGDEITQVYPISPLYLLIDAIRKVDKAAEDAPVAEASIERVAELISDRFLGVEQSGGTWRFKNRRAWYLAQNALSFFRDRVHQYREDGKNLSWELAELDDQLCDLVSGQVLPRAVDAFTLIAQDAYLPAEMDELLLDLFDQSDLEWVRQLRKTIAWLLQDLMVDRVMVPMANTLGDVIDPNGYHLEYTKGIGCLSTPTKVPLVSRLMDLVQRLMQTKVPSNRDIVAELFANFGRMTIAPDGFPMYDLAEVLAAVNRTYPQLSGEKGVEELKNILKEVSDYMLDDVRGLEKLYEQVCRRKGECY